MWLKRNVPSISGDYFTYESLRAAILDLDPEIEISSGHLSALHRGNKAAVGARLLWDIARAYAVDHAFFFDADVRRNTKIAAAEYGFLRQRATQGR